MNLNTNIDIDVKSFFLWWRGELAFLVPEKLRNALSDKSEYVFLSVKDEALQVNRKIDGEKQAIAELPLTDNAAEQFQQLIADNAELENARFILRLNSEQAIKKILYLPVAAKENLRQVVAFEMDKYTPFTAEQIYFALMPLGKEDNGQIKILLVLTPKEILDPVYQHLNKAKIYPFTVDYEGAANNFDGEQETYNLLPERKRPVKNKVAHFLNGFFSLVLLALLIAVMVLPVWHEKQTVESLKEQLKSMDKDAHLVQSMQLEIDDILAKTEGLIKEKNSAPSLTEVINTLSQLMPDDTWLTHLKYNNRRLQIQGQSTAASALIAVLEASSLLSNARFVSPLTQDKKTGKERFQISVDVNVKEDGDD